MAKVTDSNDWFELWFADKQSLLSTMVQNMAADLKAGYNYFGNSIQKQVADIDAYKAQFDKQMDEFKFMENQAVNRWCFYDLKKRGAIE
jgi:uncharacterized protein (DUF2252 family)